MGGPCPRDSSVVLVFARVPSGERAKSRIARAVGSARAIAIYRELLGEVARTVSGIRHLVSHDGEVDRPPELLCVFANAEAFVRQPQGDLGERMRAAVKAAADRGHTGFCLIGSDCPTLTCSSIEAARHALQEGVDVVIGPARDGGYYLLAIKDPGSPILRAEGWGGGGLLKETIEIANRYGLSYRLLEERDDIDTIEDYDRWRCAKGVGPRHDGELSDDRRVTDSKGVGMANNYYDPEDLADFPNIGDSAPEEGKKFFEYYSQATSAGRLTEREKALIALSVSHVQHCPYCIDAYTNKCLSLGITEQEMMETVHVGAAMTAGVVLAHSTQMRKIVKKKEL